MNKLLLVFLIFIIVFTPQKLPYLINEIVKLLKGYASVKEDIINFWHDNVQSDRTLRENIKKAQIADHIYSESKKSIDINK